jgi:cell division protein FtsL
VTVLNPNDKFKEYKFVKYGKKHESNVKWTYDFTTFKKWSLITLIVCFFAALGVLLIEERQKIEQKKEIAAESQDVKNRYLKKVLEDVKQKTIAEENRKNIATVIVNKVAEPTKPPQQRKGTKLYSWVNENGQTVYSNTPRQAN